MTGEVGQVNVAVVVESRSDGRKATIGIDSSAKAGTIQNAVSMPIESASAPNPNAVALWVTNWNASKTPDDGPRASGSMSCITAS